MRGALLTLGLCAVAAAALTAAASAQTLGPRDVDALPATAPQIVARYGDAPQQFGELRVPRGSGPFPVAVVIHGGCWTAGFATLRNLAPLASALTAEGIATWNIEYRQAGDAGGGWPGTFEDWAAATDYLRVLARTQPLDLAHAFAIGHSAGAHAAIWLASRFKIHFPSEIRGADPLPLRGAVAIDGPPEFAAFIGGDAKLCGMPVIVPFMGAAPAQQPDWYAQADPSARLPLGIPQALVASVGLSPRDAERYRRRATAAGDGVAVLDVADGGHFDIIAPGSAAFAKVEPFIVHFIRGLSGGGPR